MLRALIALFLLAPAPPAPAPTVPAELAQIFAAPPEMRLQGVAHTAEGLFVERGAVVFSDTNFWQQIRIAPDGSVLVQRVAQVANGRARDGDGHLWEASRLSQRLTRRGSDTDIVLDALPTPATNGKTIADTRGGPTRLVIARDNRVFWTDPAAYLEQSHAPPRDGASYAFRWRHPTPANDQVDRPVRREGVPRGVLGLALSPDERLLYLSDYEEGRVLVASADDLAAAPRLLADLSASNGRGIRALATDSEGHIYCAAARGIIVLNPDGSWIGMLPLPEAATDLAWDGADRRTLWITTLTGLFRVTTWIAGASPR
ncbi:SMP-30/gluconolactonase/LRE family protein [Roseiterribacter gracilis]|uniref:SMP-30/Gluconolactonase/LRE-like region domain-containing protein n=1 Tax=Roseiterribacter gracilis TaxID=2812848 RepID=A0A8S8XH72_9PROT|nr:hypothetical protein TMPK1_27270 [Rhodospirillales bacterium TMPK1]